MLEGVKNTEDSVVNPYGVNYNPIGDTHYVAFAAPDARNACGVWGMAQSEGVGVIVTLQHEDEIECKFWVPNECSMVKETKNLTKALPEHLQKDPLAKVVSVSLVKLKNKKRYAHVWYRRWVDGSIPDERDGLGVLEYLYNVVHSINNAEKVAVHCHAGRGRTGTFISFCIAKDRPGMSLGEVETLVRTHRKRAIQNVKQNRYLTLALACARHPSCSARGTDQERRAMQQINNMPINFPVEVNTSSDGKNHSFKFTYTGHPWMKKKDIYRDIFNTVNSKIGCLKLRGRGATGYAEHTENKPNGKPTIVIQYKATCSAVEV